MTAREKPKRKALHRGLDDIVNRDASLTSRLLGRVRPPEREPLEFPFPTAEELKPQTELSPPAPNSVPEEGGVDVSRLNAVASPPHLRGHGLAGSSTYKVNKPVNQSTPVSQHTSTAANNTSKSESHTVAETTTSNDYLNARARHKESLSRILPQIASEEAGLKPISFEEFVARWGILLRSGGRTGKLRICEVLYQKTYLSGEESYFTSYEKLAKLTNLEKKQCAINIRQLETLGFVERLAIFNTATKQGTEFKLHLEQLSPAGRKRPPRFYYDEEV